MVKGLYLRLARHTLGDNRRVTVPYLLTGVATAMLFYMIAALADNSALGQMRGGGVLRGLLQFGTWVAAIFSAIFLLYTNSFLIKRRKKEFALYNMMGMEKKHIARLLAVETLFIGGVSVVAGLALGLLFNKLAFLALLRLLDQRAVFGFEVSPIALLLTLGLFGFIYLLTLLGNCVRIHAASPMDLLRSASAGEREPKTRWLLAILGVLALGAGYWLSLATKDPVEALAMFFVAVLLVIAGTYLLFTAGSIAGLKLLRGNRRYYYRARNFTAVSGMLYRMKQNAVGLANICILSTMVIVTLSTTLCLYAGMERSLDGRYAREVRILTQDASEEEVDRIQAKAGAVLADMGLAPDKTVGYRWATAETMKEGDSFVAARIFNREDADAVTNLCFILLEDYNRWEGTDRTLEPKEVLLYSTAGEYPQETLRVYDAAFAIKEELPSFSAAGIDAAQPAKSLYAIVKDSAALDVLSAEEKVALWGEGWTAEGEQPASPWRYVYAFDVPGAAPEQKLELQQALNAAFSPLDGRLYVTSRESARDSDLNTYGGLFFVGVFLGALFLSGTVLIIYYKQVSEGYDDRRRYEIMQQVGMSHVEVKQSIVSQIRLVFFLPLATACVHMAFAFPVVTRMLQLFEMNDAGMFAAVCLAVVGVFALTYFLVYALTARTYYKIVS